eukprot:scaffold40479_cov22-Tisochrysis_lutea.AAC.1
MAFQLLGPSTIDKRGQETKCPYWCVSLDKVYKEVRLLLRLGRAGNAGFGWLALLSCLHEML